MKWIGEYSDFNYKREVDSELIEEINSVLKYLSDKDFNFSSSYVCGDSLLSSGGVLVNIFKSKIHHTGSTVFRLREVYTEVNQIITIMESWGFQLKDPGLKLVRKPYWINGLGKYQNPIEWDDRILDCEVYSIRMLFID